MAGKLHMHRLPSLSIPELVSHLAKSAIAEVSRESVKAVPVSPIANANWWQVVPSDRQ